MLSKTAQQALQPAVLEQQRGSHASGKELRVCVMLLDDCGRQLFKPVGVRVCHRIVSKLRPSPDAPNNNSLTATSSNLRQAAGTHPVLPARLYIHIYIHAYAYVYIYIYIIVSTLLLNPNQNCLS